ncbi:tetratricopeptide repeat protein [Cellulomonas alba]|uniref:Tetratricopeptide repeat protein n=1 Tax=Cellulomonas alba TaxID=3053467 RepID=A0ABT7SJZ8_9CELL|nr:hypothetical protein [Cellulomonas alba]MDM7856513.1 hypothetical protein [Cellulomonas alba]
MPAPEVPDDVVIGQLDRTVRARLRGLTKENAEAVGRHLLMVGQLLDVDPELAYEHAQAAVRRGGRVDVVREAAGLAAYRTERYAEALRELRTVRRLNGSSEHLPVMADCERGLGRPERAIALAAEPEAETLPGESRIELAIVVSGARLDLGQPEAAVAVLDTALARSAKGAAEVRVAQARATALEAAGRVDEARAELSRYTPEQLAESSGEIELDEEIVVFDLDEGDDESGEADDADAREGAAAAEVVDASRDADDASDVDVASDVDDAAPHGDDSTDVDDAAPHGDDSTEAGDGSGTAAGEVGDEARDGTGA